MTGPVVDHRGIPQAIFLEDVDGYMSSTEPAKTAQDVLRDFDEQLQKYKFMELNLMQRYFLAVVHISKCIPLKFMLWLG